MKSSRKTTSPATLRHLRRLAASREVDELVDQDLQRLSWVPEHLRQRLQTPDIAVMVCTEHVYEPIEALRVFPPHVGGIGCEVRRLPVRADEDAIFLVPVRRGARPERTIVLECVEERDRLGNLGLDHALTLEPVEPDPEPLEGALDQRRACAARDLPPPRRALRCSHRGSRPRAAARRAEPPRPTLGSDPSALPRRCSSTRARPSGRRRRAAAPRSRRTPRSGPTRR